MSLSKQHPDYFCIVFLFCSLYLQVNAILLLTWPLDNRINMLGSDLSFVSKRNLPIFRMQKTTKRTMHWPVKHGPPVPPLLGYDPSIPFCIRGFVSTPKGLRCSRPGIPAVRNAGWVCACAMDPRSWLWAHWSGPFVAPLGTVWKGVPSYGEPYVSP